MRFSHIAALVGAATLVAAAAPPKVVPRDFGSNDYYVIHLDSDVSPSQVALELGMTHEGQLGELADHHVFSGGKTGHDIVKRGLQEQRRRKRAVYGRSALDGVLYSQKQVLRKPWEKRRPPPRPAGPEPLQARQQTAADAAAVKEQARIAQVLNIKDPIFNEQWHLFNPVQVGHDVNVSAVWEQGITGKNATVAIVDDGLDMYSDDLKDNYYAKGSYDFNDKTEEPRPRLDDDKHGTRCAGEVSAVRNNVCGVGVAYDSKIAGLRILSKLISDADEAVAMNYDFHNNHIYSCSWGPPDDGRSMDAPGILIRRAMLNAVQNGRGGLGSIYVFASGNGAGNDDNCNFDGYTNSIYSITVGAIDRTGSSPYYSEHCSAGLVVTYSSGAGDAIHTTDVGTNACYSNHGGTSAAAPLAAGIFALSLQIRPDLTWRDMQYLALMTAVPINLDTGGWQDTTIGKKFSHTFGYGKVDSYGMVEAAKTWKNVKPQAWYFSPWLHVKQPIPQGDEGLVAKFEVTAAMLEKANVERLEHVTVTMNVEHTRRGDLSVDLISPDGIKSALSVPRRLDNAKAGYVDWTFMSVAHWGESGIGTWTIIVRDTKVNEYNGTFVDWHLKLWGEARDPAKASPLPMPTEEDDQNHDQEVSTTTVPAVTTTLPAGSDATDKPAMTTDANGHPDRPVNSKPTGTDASSGSKPSDQGSASTDTPASQSHSSWLPSFLPTFGVSSKTQAWIYGGLALVLVFCCGLGVYLFIARRRRLRNSPRDDYEFELLDEEETEGLNGGGEKGFAAGGKKGRKTRGGELYDAFAGGSDDEDDEYADGQYRDRDEVGGARSEKRSAGGVNGGDNSEDDDVHHVIGDDSDDDEDAREKGDSNLLGRH